MTFVLVDALHPAGWRWQVWNDNRVVRMGLESNWLWAQVRGRASAARYATSAKMGS